MVTKDDGASHENERVSMRDQRAGGWVVMMELHLEGLDSCEVLEIFLSGIRQHNEGEENRRSMSTNQNRTSQ